MATIRSSRLYEPETSAIRRAPGKIAEVVGRIANYASIARMWNQESRPEPTMPVSERAMELAQFIAAHADLNRLHYTKVSRKAEKSEPYSLDEVVERRHEDKRCILTARRAQPFAGVDLYGRNYSRYPVGQPDNFVCRFGVYALNDGGRLLQASPQEWADVSYAYEYDAMRSSLRELFGEGGVKSDVEQYALINLGTIDQDGKLVPMRAFNEHAFGADLVPLLDKISSPDIENDLLIDIFEGLVREYTD